MNLKLLALGTTGAVAVTGASVGVAYLAGAFDDGSFVPTGKTLKTRYPKLKVKKYQKIIGTAVDNSFWSNKAKALKTKPYYTNKDIWDPILKSIEKNKTVAEYNLQDKHFVLDNSSNTFTSGDGEVAEVIGKYCDYSADKEEPTIKNYADILKDLCT